MAIVDHEEVTLDEFLKIEEEMIALQDRLKRVKGHRLDARITYDHKGTFAVNAEVLGRLAAKAVEAVKRG